MFYTNVAQQGNFIYCVGYDKNGEKFYLKQEYHPNLFIKSKSDNPQFRALDGTPLDEIRPGNIFDTKEFLKSYTGISNFNYWGMEKWVFNYIVDTFKGNIEYDISKFKTAFIDIETECERGFPDIQNPDDEILIITLECNDVYHVFFSEKYGKFETTDRDVKTYAYKTEFEMLNGFINFFKSQEYDILSGWYTDGFDVPYIINRCNKVVGQKKTNELSPWGMIKPKTIRSVRGDIESYDIVGVNHLDYQTAYLKFSGSRPENYKLDTVAFEELGEKKLDYSEYTSIKDLYKLDFAKYVRYNIQDVRILKKLNEKKNIISLIISMALEAKVNLLDVFKQTRLWDSNFYNYLLARNIVIPRMPETGDRRPFEGGYVKDTIPGRYKWCVSFDLDALYPHLIMWMNLSPETFVGQVEVNIDHLIAGRDLPELRDAKKNDWAFSANGCYFRRDVRGFIPELMDKLYAERKAFKKEMLRLKKHIEDNKATLTANEIAEFNKKISTLNVLQSVRKENLNSCYGSLAQNGFRFFDRELARAITLSGQLAAQWMARKFNEFLNKQFKTNKDWVVAIDTDSVHLSLDYMVQQLMEKKPDLTNEQIVDILDKFADGTLQKYINNSYEELAEYMNAYEQKLAMKRETIADQGVFLKKKKYAYHVYDLEGVRFKEPIIKVTGMDIVKSSTPKYCRDELKDCLRIVFEGSREELVDKIAKVKSGFVKLPFEEVAIPSGASDMETYANKQTIYSKGCPIHVRAGLIYNKVLEDKGLDKKYEKILSGDKMKFSYMKMPNPLFENVFGVAVTLPPELNLEKYVDHDAQFDRAFMSPLRGIAEAIDWDLTNKSSLEDFWA